MRKRSSKILAASLSLLIGLNGMPLSALAVENDPTQTATEQTVQEEPEGEPASGSQEQSGEAGPATEPATEQEQPEATEPVETEPEQKENLPQETGEPQQPAEETEAAPAESDEEKAESAAAGATADGAETQPQTDPAVPEEEGPSAAPAQQAAKAVEQTPQEEPSMMLMGADTLQEDTVYVSADGADGAYTSLQEAVKDAPDGATIVLKSDVEANGTARISDKHLTITSEEGQCYTISRGETFQTIADNNQSWYNGAIIEVTAPTSGDSDNASSVTLKNVVLDDKGLHQGTYFAQTNMTTVSESNENFVQDSMITAHGKTNAAVHIILEEGAELRNFGGMSALYGTTNAHITMKAGSKVSAPDVADRVKSDPKNPPKDETGAAGAVWLQGSEFTMEAGAVIEKVVGRAVYADGGTATIAGTIRDITGDKEMWQGQNGVAVHIRNGAAVTLAQGGKIDGISASSAGVILQTRKAQFTMEAGAEISNIRSTAISAQGTGTEISETHQQKDELSLTIDGKVTGVTGGNVVNLNDSDGIKCTILQNALFENNTLTNGALYMQGKDVTVDFYGKINNNVCTNGPAAIWVANNYKGGSLFTMYDGAEVKNNVSSVNECGTINVSMGTFRMEGGTISGNYVVSSSSGASEQAAPVWVRRNGTFDMRGGTITGNYTNNNTSGAVLFDADIYNSTTVTMPVVELHGGTITGNFMNATITQDSETKQYSATGGEEMNVTVSTLVGKNGETSYGNINRYMQISEGMEIGDAGIYLKKYDVCLGRPAGDVKFGNAADASVEMLKQAVTEQGWGDPLVAMWVYSDSGEAALTVEQPGALQKDRPVYLAAVPVDEEGLPQQDAAVTFYGATKQENGVQATVPGDNEYGYAVALVQPGEDYGAMTLSVPEQVDAKQIGEGENSYQIPGTAVYTMSDNLLTLMKAQKPDAMTLSVELDPALQVDPEAVTLTSSLLEMAQVTYDKGILTMTCTLKEGWESAADRTATLKWTGILGVADFQAGKILETAGAFRATVPDDAEPISIYVPAQPAVTQLVDGVILTAADIVVYMGGQHGYEGVVSDGTIVGSQSLPEPGFRVQLPEGIQATDLKFYEAESGKSWTLQPYDGDTTHEIYKIVPAEGQDPLRVQFTNAAGETVTSDGFTVGDAVNQTYTMSIYHGSVGTVLADTIQNPGNAALPVLSESGTLTVRGTTGGVQFSKMNSPAETGKPAVRADGKVTFTINGSDVEANQNSIALLFDYIIEKTPSEADRSALLAKKADEVLNKAIPAGMVRNYSFRYLDLVDTSNGNTWVEARDENGEIAEVTVSWPYPEGTDQNTEFTLLHFEGLHRDMNSNEVAGDIAGCTVTPVSITKTATHIEFTTKGFSPFALVWDGEQAVTPPAGGETEETQEGGSGDTGSTTPQATAKPAAPTAAAPAAQPAAVIPQTGDESNPLLWVVLLAISGSLGTALVLKRRKEQ